MSEHLDGAACDCEHCAGKALLERSIPTLLKHLESYGVKAVGLSLFMASDKGDGGAELSQVAVVGGVTAAIAEFASDWPYLLTCDLADESGKGPLAEAQTRSEVVQ